MGSTQDITWHIVGLRSINGSPTGRTRLLGMVHIGPVGSHHCPVVILGPSEPGQQGARP